MVALAWQLEQDTRCPGCQQPWHQTTDPDSFEAYEAEGVVCFACAERETEARRFRENEQGPPPGLYVTVHRRGADLM